MDSVWNRNRLVPFVARIAFECMACCTFYQVSMFSTREHCWGKLMEFVASCDR